VVQRLPGSRGACSAARDPGAAGMGVTRRDGDRGRPEGPEPGRGRCVQSSWHEAAGQVREPASQDRSLTEHWARPPARGRRRRRRDRPARPRRICPPSRGSGPAAAAPVAGSPHVSPLRRNRRRVTPPWQLRRRVPAGQAVAPAVPGSVSQAHADSGLGREQLLRHGFQGGRTGRDVARPRHPTQQPSLPRGVSNLRLRKA
jgi:hypothetical protein